MTIQIELHFARNKRQRSETQCQYPPRRLSSTSPQASFLSHPLWPQSSHHNSSPHHHLPLLTSAWMSFFNNFPSHSTSTVPSSNQLVCIICKQPAEKEENMEICSDFSCLEHAHHACGQFDNGRFVCCSLHKPTNLPE